MNRTATNAIRFLMDECVPPLIRDNRYFMLPFYVLAYRGKNVREAMEFKTLVHGWSDEEYDRFYNSLDTISRNRLTDLNKPSLDLILDAIDPSATSLIDVGAGKGYLLRQIKERRPELDLHGLDVLEGHDQPEYRYTRGRVEDLPFPDRSFDVVVSSHTIEHLLHLDRAVEELKRVARKQVIVATPCQRYFYYTLDEHVNFFPFAAALTSVMQMRDHTLVKALGDWVYVGRVDSDGGAGEARTGEEARPLR